MRNSQGLLNPLDPHDPRYLRYQRGQPSSDCLQDDNGVRRTSTRGSTQSHASVSTQSWGYLGVPRMGGPSSSKVASQVTLPPAAWDPHRPTAERLHQYGTLGPAESGPFFESLQDKALPDVPRNRSFIGRLFSGLEHLPKTVLGVRREKKRGHEGQAPSRPRRPHPPQIMITPSLPSQPNAPLPPLPTLPRSRPPGWSTRSLGTRNRNKSDTTASAAAAAMMQEIRADPRLAWLEQLGLAALHKRGLVAEEAPGTPADGPSDEDGRPGRANFRSEWEEEEIPAQVGFLGEETKIFVHADRLREEAPLAQLDGQSEEARDLTQASQHHVGGQDEEKPQDGADILPRQTHRVAEEVIPVATTSSEREKQEGQEEEEWVEIVEKDIVDGPQNAAERKARKARKKAARAQATAEGTRTSWFGRRSPKQSPRYPAGTVCPACGAVLLPSSSPSSPSSESSNPPSHAGRGCSHTKIETHHTGDFFIMNFSNMNNDNSRRYRATRALKVSGVKKRFLVNATARR